MPYEKFITCGYANMHSHASFRKTCQAGQLVTNNTYAVPEHIKNFMLFDIRINLSDIVGFKQGVFWSKSYLKLRKLKY